MSTGGWIGVDLDGTLARYDGWRGELHIGEPIRSTVTQVRNWVAQGIEVRIFTARVCRNVSSDKARASVDEIRTAIQDWCEKHIGHRLKVTNEKDFGMVLLIDDRAAHVIPNEGRICCRTSSDLLP